MPLGPGGLPAEQRERSTAEFRRRVVERWGEERAAAMDVVIERTAIAVAAMLALEFVADEAPGFYLPSFQDGDVWRTQ